jgi:transposase
LCQRIEEEGWSLRAAAEAAGLSEPRARAWLARWRTGDQELADRRSGPARRHPRRTAPEREAVIAELREHVRMSAVAIAEALGSTIRGVADRRR